MPNNVTKVKTNATESQAEKSTSPGWGAGLADIRADIAYLKALVPIVERKIKWGEPWPGDSAT